MASRGEKTLKEILKESLQHFSRLLTSVILGLQVRIQGRPPLKFAKIGREKRERKKKGKERKEEEREEKEKEKKERENLSTPHRLRK